MSSTKRGLSAIAPLSATARCWRAGGALRDPPAVFARDPLGLIAHADALSVPETSKRRPGALALCLHHPAVRDALRLANADAWLAGFLLVRLVTASSGDRDGEPLAAACWRRRSGVVP